MIILGIILWAFGYILGDAGAPVPLFIITVLEDVGGLLIILGIVLLVLSFFGISLGRGIYNRNGRAYWL